MKKKEVEKKGGHVSRRSESATSQVQRLSSWGRYLSPRGKHTHWYCCRSTAELWAVSSPSFRIFRNLGRSRLVSWPEKLPSALAQREARPETASPALPTYAELPGCVRRSASSLASCHEVRRTSLPSSQDEESLSQGWCSIYRHFR